MPLDALEIRYFGGSSPVARADTQARALIDGVDYFDAIHAAIEATGAPGDLIHIAGWRFVATWDLLGRRPGDAGFETVADLLARKAHAGVDVRLVLSCHMSRAAGSVPTMGPLPLAQMLDAADALRGAVPAGASAAPLADRVLLDFSGALVGSHHQKFTAVKAGADTVAFVGGIDYLELRRDDGAHDTMHWSADAPDPHKGSAYGWHDAGIELRGGAVARVFEEFRARWNEAATLPRRHYVTRPTLASPMIRRIPLNPAVATSVPTVPVPGTVPVTTESVQVLRSRFPFKLPEYDLLRPGVPWDAVPGGGITEVYDTLTTAIDGAQRWIYIEDQYLGDSPLGPLPAEVAAAAYSIMPNLLAAVRRGVKLIMVGSGKNDGDPPPFALVNQDYDEAGDVRSGITDILDAEAAAAGTPSRSADVAVWRMDILTVHSKLCLIDDAFAAIGSANIHSRSMYGNDSELHIAVVSDGDWVTRVRKRLWAEHLGIGTGPWPAALETALEDEATALGMWKPAWLPGPAAPDMWQIADSPPGFRPAAVRRTYVGPA